MSIPKSDLIPFTIVTPLINSHTILTEQTRRDTMSNTNTKNVLLIQGVLMSILAGAYKSIAILILCLALIIGITIIKTKFWVITFAAVFTTIWGFIGFEIGYYFNSLGIELILATFFLSLVTGINMVYLSINDYIAPDKLKRSLKDC